MTDPNKTSVPEPECVWCGQTMAGHRDSGPMAKMPCGGLKRGFIAEIGSKLFSETSVGDVPAPKFKCCSPRCPGYSFKASEMPHPAETCGLPPALQQDIRNIIAATVSDGVAIGARDERAAVVKYLRTMAESTTFTTRAQSALRLAAEEIEGGMHQP